MDMRVVSPLLELSTFASIVFRVLLRYGVIVYVRLLESGN